MFKIKLIDRKQGKIRYIAGEIESRAQTYYFGNSASETILEFIKCHAQQVNVGVDNIEQSANTTCFLVEIKINAFPDPRTELLSMTFRNFVIHKLKDDQRIKGIPLFHSILGKGGHDPGYTRWPASLEMYPTLGDVPLSELIQVPEMEFLRIRNVSSKALRALKNILADYQLALKEL